MSIDLTTLSAREVLSAVYIGYYNRAADAAGIQFWEQVIANTSLDLEAIATDFAGQSETQAVHPFFADPATSTPGTFITSLYQNLFNRDPDAAGLEFWSEQLQNAIDGVEGSFSVGEIIVKIIEGAVDVEGGTQDRTTILNKIEVAQDWTDAAEANNGEFDAAAMANAKAVIADVTSEASTVVDAKAATDAFFEATTPTNPGDTIFLTSATDVETGTENDDQFNAYIQQNPFAGGVSNSLSSADRLDGGAGNDRLYAEVTGEFVGVVGNVSNVDIQPRLSGIEEIDIEARESTFLTTEFLTGGPVVVDAKNITDHVEIGSYFSDGDLKIENMTTLTAGGSARNTSEITVTMDHTDNFNSDEDASDLEVLFDNDYLLSGQESVGQVFYFLLDEDAELAGLDNRLDNIDVDGIRFNITNADGSVTAVVIEAPEANTAGTHQGFVNALQPALQALIADGTLPAGTTLTLDPTLTDFTFIDDGSQSDPIPAIVLTTGDGSAVTATGFSRIEDEIGEYDVYGRFDQLNETADQPISVDVELHKAGRGGEGGNLIVGGKSTNTDEASIADGIEVINVSVKGHGDNDSDGMTKPSNVGTITSTGNELRVVNITTDAEFASATTHASLTVRNGFDQSTGTNSNVENGDLQLINADGFLGDLTLGDIDAANNAGRVTNADTITAQGGGDVTLGLHLDGTEVDQAYSVTTSGGNDSVDMTISGNALDYANSSVNVSTGGGNDDVNVSFVAGDGNSALNHVILDNVTVNTGEGDDVVNVDNVGQVDITSGAGNDVVYTDGGTATAKWAFNYDDAVAGATGTTVPSIDTFGLPGEATSLAYLNGATITVTLSGAGTGGYASGGGVMSNGAAVQLDNGYESTVTIGSLINGNTHYGDQRDVNAAVIAAIENDPVLNALLSVEIGANNTLVVSSKTSGAFDAEDLRIDIAQETWTSATNSASVLAEARQLFGDSSLVEADLFGAAPTATSTYLGTAPGADLTGDNGDAWYDGLSTVGGTNQVADNLHVIGTASAAETDNTINGGSGDDVIVLSTDATGTALPLTAPGFTKSPENSLINDASNETIELSGSSIGNDTVMNFTALQTEAGLDFLDLTAYLTSLEDESTNPPGTDSADSHDEHDTTLSGDVAGVAANEVIIIDFTETTADTFEGLGASQIAAIFNGTGAANDYGSFTADGSGVASQTDDQVVGGNGKAVMMVQNVNNDGEYKLFELSWNADAALADQTFTVNGLGSLDFGEELDNAGDATFLVGSAAYDALFV